MIWNVEKQTVSIDWYEDKKGKEKEAHFFEKKPFKLQLHPISKVVIRAYFHGTRPAWITRYAKEFRYGTEEVSTEKGKGWFVSNWKLHLTDEIPLLSPFIQGAIEEWYEKIDMNCDRDKTLLLNNIDTVEMNLTYYAHEFSELGFHFRPEEIHRNGGALVVESKIIPIDHEGVFTHSDWPEYQILIKSLIKERPIPEEVEEFLLQEDDEDEVILDLSFVESVEGELEAEEEPLLIELDDDEGELIIDLTSDEEIVVLDSLDDAEPLMVLEESVNETEQEPSINDAALLTVEDLMEVEEEELLIEEVISEEDLLDEVELEQELVLEEDNSTQVQPLTSESLQEEIVTNKVVEIETKLPKLRVSEKAVKKEGIMAGQTFLF